MVPNEGSCAEVALPSERRRHISAREGLIDGGAAASDSRRRAHASITEGAALNQQKMYFPLGFPIRIVTNHASVLAAADQSWSKFMPAFDRTPLEILIEVLPDPIGMRVMPPAPTCTIKGGLIVQEADEHNFVIADLHAGWAVGRVSELTARSHSYFCYHLLEGTVLSMLATLHCVPLHAACVQIAGKGVLICGNSGDGKSTLAFAGARAGWTYVSDDATYLPIERRDRMVVGNCHKVRFRPSAAQLFPELSGRRITPRAAGKPSIEVPTSEWHDLACANSTVIDAIVFLNRGSDDEQQLIPRQASSVCDWFKQHIIPSPEFGPMQEATLARLLKANVFELRYRDLPWGIARLQQLAENGI